MAYVGDRHPSVPPSVPPSGVRGRGGVTCFLGVIKAGKDGGFGGSRKRDFHGEGGREQGLLTQCS